jgi:hypothetical protein
MYQFMNFMITSKQFDVVLSQNIDALVWVYMSIVQLYIPICT